MKFGFVKSAVIVPNMHICNPKKNAEIAISAINEAVANGIELLSFPELSLTGVNLNSLYLNQKLLNDALFALKKTAESTVNKDVLVFIGLPIKIENKVFNAVAAINNGKILAVIPKNSLSDLNGCLESKYFSAWEKDNIEIELFGEKIPFGNKIYFREKTNMFFTASVCFVGEKEILPTNILIMPASQPEWIGKKEFIEKMLSSVSTSFNSAILFANAGIGESGSDVVFSGRSYIYENGKKIANTVPFKNEFAVNEIDAEYISFEKSKSKQTSCENCIEITFCANTEKEDFNREYKKFPFVPKDKESRKVRANDILEIQSKSLQNRFLRSRSKTLVIGLSGGLDSTLALLVCHKALADLNLPVKNVIAVTMPCFGTTSRTLENSINLAKTLGVTLKKIDISRSVKRHLKDIKHDGSFDVTFENAQARERTQVLMDIANSCGGLVVGTGDLSEIALGWSTYNGDHMSMFAVNFAIPKTLIREVVKNYAECHRGKLRAVLLDILGTPVSPELLPPDKGEITQKTEDIVGPYELHDFFLYHFISRGASPKKLKAIAFKVFKDEYNIETISKWLNKFFNRFITQQFKRSCSPEGVKTGNVSLSPRGEFNIPSDCVPDIWTEND